MDEETKEYIKNNIEKWREYHQKNISEFNLSYEPSFSPGDICLKRDYRGKALYYVIVKYFYGMFNGRFGKTTQYWTESINHIVTISQGEEEDSLSLKEKYIE